MTEKPISLITHLSWGEMQVSIAGNLQQFKDCKVWPGGARAWDWNETGTRHSPGIQPADVQELLDQEIGVLILSRGQLLRLGVCLETEELLRQRGIEFYTLETKRAVDLFNELTRQGKRVGGLFHSTC
jgi:hypothetical protein